ncbi:hypothetical protein ABZP36_006572 [Zizania latifolia]
MSKNAIIGASTVLVVAVVAAVCVVSFKNGSSNGKGDGEMSTSVKSIKSFCQPVDYRETCESALEETTGNTTNPTDLAKAIFKATSERIEKALQESTELLDYAIDDLKTTFEKLGGFEMNNFKNAIDDLNTWLSSALTYQETCLDGFENATSTEASQKMQNALKSSQELTENILAIVEEFGDTLANLKIPNFSRRLLDDNGLPGWIPDAKRRLLLASPGSPEFKPDVTVAADGSSDCKMINEALAKVPLKSMGTYVMYVKVGIYKEHVLARNVTNLIMIGDGTTKTIIMGNKSFMLNITTKDMATMEAIGNGFFMRSIGVKNTAGAKNHQAVALRYYRDCTITGTIDFIFGNAQVVFQNCLIQVRRCMDNQQNIVTAQGRKEKHSADGTSNIGGFIDPQGWLPWLGDFGLNTCYYAEVENHGAGTDMSKRVKWRGVKVVTYKQAQQKYTVERFI